MSEWRISGRRSTCWVVIGCRLQYWLRLRMSARRLLRGRWSDGQLALLFSIAFLFAARGMFGSQSIDASNVSPMPSGVLHVVIALVKPPAHV